MKDLSKAPMPGGRPSTSKREKYDWADPGSAGVFQLLPKLELNVDYDAYQRATIHPKSTKIAREFWWPLFEPLMVAKRNDGRYWVFSGAHRLRAARMRDDVTVVPCIVYYGMDLEDEAKAFRLGAKNRSAISAFDSHRAAVTGGDEIAIEARRIVEMNGYSISKNVGEFCFRGIGTVEAQVKKDRVLAEKAFALAAEIAGGSWFSHEILVGVFYILQRRPDAFDRSTIAKLAVIGARGLASAITRDRVISGKGGERQCGLTLLAEINRSRKIRRIALD